VKYSALFFDLAAGLMHMNMKIEVNFTLPEMFLLQHRTRLFIPLNVDFYISVELAYYRSGS